MNENRGMAGTGHDTIMKPGVHEISLKAPFPQGRNILLD
jgi:hypothetical protein